MNDLEAFGVEVGKGNYGEESFYGLVLTYTLLFDQVADYLDAYGLTPAKMNVLMVIKHQGGEQGLSQREIGKWLLVTASNMTRLLDKLEREGLITRGGMAGDKRVKLIRVTAKASHLLDRAWPGYMKTIICAMNVLSPADQKILSAMLQRLVQALKAP
ncbi:MAG: MarR family transcriptional regulator [Candidatus Omnitrophica bacterium]|nr:MarR family transcriptional regulator [Candidatus Omnitrophota bacterium]